MNSKICALLFVIALGPVTIKADEFFPGTEPIEAAVRLESIKASLLDYALDHSVYVSTQVGWTATVRSREKCCCSAV